VLHCRFDNPTNCRPRKRHVTGDQGKAVALLCERPTAKLLTKDEARRIAANVATPLELVRK
jgi:hypothetical protein